MLRLDCRSEAEEFRDLKRPHRLYAAWHFNFTLPRKRVGFQKTPPALRRVVLHLQPTGGREWDSKKTPPALRRVVLQLQPCARKKAETESPRGIKPVVIKQGSTGPGQAKIEEPRGIKPVVSNKAVRYRARQKLKNHAA